MVDPVPILIYVGVRLLRSGTRLRLICTPIIVTACGNNISTRFIKRPIKQEQAKEIAKASEHFKAVQVRISTDPILKKRASSFLPGQNNASDHRYDVVSDFVAMQTLDTRREL